MKIIFDEIKYAEELLTKGFSRYMSVYDMTILAKYYKEKGLSKKEIKDNLIAFVKKFNKKYNDIIHYKYIEIAIKNTEKYKLKTGNYIGITEDEMKKIVDLKNYKYEKILFIIILLTKFYNKENEKDYYLNIPFNQILKIAKVNVSKEEQYYIKHLFYRLGYWIATYFNSHKIKCIDRKKDKKIILNIDLSKDLIEQYSNYKKASGLGLYICECGNSFIKKSNSQKYCNECKIKKYKEIVSRKNERYRKKRLNRITN